MLSYTTCPNTFTKSCLHAIKARNARKSFLQITFFFMLVTQICIAQWVQLGLEDKGIKDIAARNSTIFAVTSDSAVYRSIDSGINWLEIVDTGAIDIAVSSSVMIFMVKKSEPIWGYPTSSLFSSSNNGDIWDTLNVVEQLPPVPWGWPAWPTNVSVSPTGLVVCGIYVTHDLGGYLTSLALSADYGATWTSPGWDLVGGMLFGFRDQSVITLGGSYGRGGIGELINLSYDNGQTWLARSPHPSPWVNISICLNGNTLLGVPSGLYLSTDSCSTWTQVSWVHTQSGLSIASGGTLVGTDSLGVFLFSDDGDSLGFYNAGLTNLNIHTLTTDNNGYVYVGTDNGVWRRPLSEMILPVELNSFTATTNIKEVILNWSTVTELNNQGFEIQRKAFGGEFATVAFVKGQGTTTQQNQYSFADKNLDEGKYSYRLKQVDFSGTFEYSKIIEVELSPVLVYSLRQNYPNPFNPVTTIGYALQEKGNTKLILMNAIGEEVAILVNEEQDKGYHKVEFNAANLPSGVYFYQLSVYPANGGAGSFVETSKMILFR